MLHHDMTWNSLKDLTPIVLGGGQGGQNTPCPCSHNNNIAQKKLIFLFDTALVMANT